MEMEMQQEFAAYSWGNNGSLKGSESILLRDDFDLNSILPIELSVPKYTENLTLAPQMREDWNLGMSSLMPYRDSESWRPALF